MNTNNKDKTIGQWMKDLRDREGLSQAHMADILGYNNSQSIAMIEMDKKLLPVDKWAVFCKFFNINLKQFCFTMYHATLKFKEKETNNSPT